MVVDDSFSDMRPSHEPAAATGTATGALAKDHAATAQTTPAEMRVIQRFVIVFLAHSSFRHGQLGYAKRFERVQ